MPSGTLSFLDNAVLAVQWVKSSLVVMAQGREGTWYSVCFVLGCVPFIDVALKAGTLQLLHLYSKLGWHVAALIW